MIYNYVMCTVISGVKIEGAMMDVYVCCIYACTVRTCIVCTALLVFCLIGSCFFLSVDIDISPAGGCKLCGRKKWAWRVLLPRSLACTR